MCGRCRMGMLQGPPRRREGREAHLRRGQPRGGLDFPPEVRLYLALADLEKKWKRSIRDWSNVLGELAVFFNDRLPNL
jgi:hypothetical protein